MVAWWAPVAVCVSLRISMANIALHKCTCVLQFCVHAQVELASAEGMDAKVIPASCMSDGGTTVDQRAVDHGPAQKDAIEHCLRELKAHVLQARLPWKPEDWIINAYPGPAGSNTTWQFHIEFKALPVKALASVQSAVETAASYYASRNTTAAGATSQANGGNHGTLRPPAFTLPPAAAAVAAAQVQRARGAMHAQAAPSPAQELPTGELVPATMQEQLGRPFQLTVTTASSSHTARAEQETSVVGTEFSSATDPTASEAAGPQTEHVRVHCAPEGISQHVSLKRCRPAESSPRAPDGLNKINLPSNSYNTHKCHSHGISTNTAVHVVQHKAASREHFSSEQLPAAPIRHGAAGLTPEALQQVLQLVNEQQLGASPSQQVSRVTEVSCAAQVDSSPISSPRAKTRIKVTRARGPPVQLGEPQAHGPTSMDCTPRLSSTGPEPGLDAHADAQPAQQEPAVNATPALCLPPGSYAAPADEQQDVSQAISAGVIEAGAGGCDELGVPVTCAWGDKVQHALWQDPAGSLSSKDLTLCQFVPADSNFQPQTPWQQVSGAQLLQLTGCPVDADWTGLVQLAVPYAGKPTGCCLYRVVDSYASDQPVEADEAIPMPAEVQVFRQRLLHAAEPNPSVVDVPDEVKMVKQLLKRAVKPSTDDMSVPLKYMAREQAEAHAFQKIETDCHLAGLPWRPSDWSTLARKSSSQGWTLAYKFKDSWAQARASALGLAEKYYSKEARPRPVRGGRRPPLGATAGMHPPTKVVADADPALKHHQLAASEQLQHQAGTGLWLQHNMSEGVQDMQTMPNLQGDMAVPEEGMPCVIVEAAPGVQCYKLETAPCEQQDMPEIIPSVQCYRLETTPDMQHDMPETMPGTQCYRLETTPVMQQDMQGVQCFRLEATPDMQYNVPETMPGVQYMLETTPDVPHHVPAAAQHGVAGPVPIVQQSLQCLQPYMPETRPDMPRPRQGTRPGAASQCNKAAGQQVRAQQVMNQEVIDLTSPVDTPAAKAAGTSHALVHVAAIAPARTAAVVVQGTDGSLEDGKRHTKRTAAQPQAGAVQGNQARQIAQVSKGMASAPPGRSRQQQPSGKHDKQQCGGPAQQEQHVQPRATWVPVSDTHGHDNHIEGHHSKREQAPVYYPWPVNPQQYMVPVHNSLVPAYYGVESRPHMYNSAMPARHPPPPNYQVYPGVWPQHELELHQPVQGYPCQPPYGYMHQQWHEDPQHWAPQGHKKSKPLGQAQVPDRQRLRELAQTSPEAPHEARQRPSQTAPQRPPRPVPQPLPRKSYQSASPSVPQQQSQLLDRHAPHEHSQLPSRNVRQKPSHPPAPSLPLQPSPLPRHVPEQGVSRSLPQAPSQVQLQQQSQQPSQHCNKRSSEQPASVQLPEFLKCVAQEDGKPPWPQAMTATLLDVLSRARDAA